MKRCDSLLILLATACFFGAASILLSVVGCSSPYGKLIPAKEMAIYNLESRIALLERYDEINETERNKDEVAKMRQQILGLRKAIEEEKNGKKN